MSCHLEETSHVEVALCKMICSTFEFDFEATLNGEVSDGVLNGNVCRL